MAFEGSESLLRFAWEATPGVTPWNAAWHDQMFNSEGLAAQLPLIQPNALRGGRQRTLGLPTKITTSGAVAVDLEPQGHGYWLAAFQKGGAAVATLTAGQSFRHKLAPSYTTVNHDKTFSQRISRNNRLPQLSPGCLVSSFAISVGVGSVVTADFGITAQRASYYDMATVVLETSTPTRPILRGVPQYSVLSAADADLYVTVSNVSGQVLVKVGAAGTNTAAQVLTAGAWNSLLYHPAATDVPLGDPDNPVQLYVPDFTNWTAGGTPDQWRFKLNHVDLENPWTPTFPAIENLNEIHAGITIDGVTTVLTELSLSGALEVNPNFGIGGRYSAGLQERGLRTYSGQLNRQQIDNDLLERLLSSEPFELDLIITSRELIGTSADPYRLRAVAPKCLFSGNSPGVPGPNIFEEPFAFDCYPDPLDGTHPDEVTIYLDNSVADMTV